MTKRSTASLITTAPFPFGYRKTVTALLLLVLLFTLMLAVPLMAADQTQYQNHTVVAGDTLYLISLKYNTTVNALISANSLTSTEIRVGQVLKVPVVSGCNYTVKWGDTLYLISQRFGTTVADLVASNNLNSDLLMPGQSLLLPNNSLYVEYLVQPGDTLYLISVKFSTTVAGVKSLNQLSSDMLSVGQSLRVPRATPISPDPPTSPPEPEPGKYTVKSGDTLYLLSQRYGTTVQKLMEINPLTSTSLWVGQVLLIPGYDPGQEPAPPEPPVTSWTVPSGAALIHVASGQCLWDLVQKYKTSQPAIMTTNHLHTDMLLVNQPLFIPLNSTTPISVSAPRVSSKPGYGEWLDWEYASWIFDACNEAVIKDLLTGKEFRVKRYGGSNHADCEPLTVSDTNTMKEIYGGNWSWERRAVLVEAGDRIIAGSMAGMPHDTDSITSNGFDGHFDLHFLNSRTHSTNQIDALHQAMVQKAAGY